MISFVSLKSVISNEVKKVLTCFDQTLYTLILLKQFWNLTNHLDTSFFRKKKDPGQNLSAMSLLNSVLMEVPLFFSL